MPWVRACGLAALVALAGCSGDPAGNAAASAQPVREAPASSDPVAQMVAAVPSGGPASLVDLRFELTSRPVAGRPVDLAVAVLPVVDNMRGFRVVFESNDLVEVRGGGEFVSGGPPRRGSAYLHTISVLPRRDGVAYLSAVVLVDQDGVSVGRSFAIPLIVGDSFAASSATP